MSPENWPVKLHYMNVENMEKALEWEPRKTDIVATAYPKSGTTWLNSICHQLVLKGKRGPKRSLDDGKSMTFYPTANEHAPRPSSTHHFHGKQGQ